MGIENPRFSPDKGPAKSPSSSPIPTPLGEEYDRVYAGEKPAFGGGLPDGIVERIPDLVAGGKVLDIGAGEGRNSLYLAHRGFSVTAVDLSNQAITKLRDNATAKGLALETSVGDVRHMSLEEEYAVVVSSFMLHHLPRGEAVALLEKIKQHTNPGGINAIATITKQGDFYRDNPEGGGFYPELGELKSLYRDWEIIDYSEEEGQALSTREDGTPKVNVSARILARKPLPP